MIELTTGVLVTIILTSPFWFSLIALVLIIIGSLIEEIIKLFKIGE